MSSLATRPGAEAWLRCLRSMGKNSGPVLKKQQPSQIASNDDDQMWLP